MVESARLMGALLHEFLRIGSGCNATSCLIVRPELGEVTSGSWDGWKSSHGLQLEYAIARWIAREQEISRPMKMDRRQTPNLALILTTMGVVIWAYWTTLVEVVERWENDPQYSHGFLVPLFSGYLLWMRRDRLQGTGLGARWWGLGIVAGAVVLRLASHFFYQPWLDTGSLLVCLAGIAAAVGGRRALIWAGPSILFLIFMLPLPYRFQTLLGGTLQRIATLASAYVLQTFGVPAVTEGNVILLTETKLGVVEACNGLSMLFTFFALATAVAILSQRGWPEKIAIFFSAVPIAILANVVRITVTGLLFEASQDELARTVFHDLAGWLMMPLALGMLLVELFVLGRSIVRIGDAAPRPSGRTVPVVG
jgi:exosortase